MRLYLFRCYKRREHMSSEEKRLERRLHSFVCYLGIECGKALMGLRLPGGMPWRFPMVSGLEEVVKSWAAGDFGAFLLNF